MFWACFKNDLGRFGHDLGMIWECFGHVLELIWELFGNVLGMFLECFRNAFKNDLGMFSE